MLTLDHRPQPPSAAARAAVVSLVVLGALLVGGLALARPGGGESFSGGGGGSGGGGDAADGLGLILDLLVLCVNYPYIGIPLVVVMVVLFLLAARKGKAHDWATREGKPAEVRWPEATVPRARIERLRRDDPEFSPIILEDFLYTLYAELQRARGSGRAPELSPYVSPPLLARLSADQGLTEVKGIVIGGMRLVQLSGVDAPAPRVELCVEFEANYTEVSRAGGDQRLCVKDRVALSRAAGVKSRPPARARTLDCPNCGAALQSVRGSECSYCHEQVSGGRFDWTVDGMEHLASEPRGPLLTSTVKEAGTSLPTIIDSSAPAHLQALQARDPSFTLELLQQRALVIFRELQLGWSSRDWMRVRPFVSDNLFQSQMYWIGLYQQARARNATDNARIVAVHLAKVWSDKHYDAVTLRLFATGLDYVISDDGKVLSGSTSKERNYSEYWTLIRGAQRTGAGKGDLCCPSCGAPLKIGMTGSCEYCQAKVTTGEFDWVLSRIEQDETYRG